MRDHELEAPDCSFTAIPNSTLDRLLASGATGSQLAVFLVICRRANVSGECWPSINRICLDTGLSRQSVCVALKWLADECYIETIHRNSDGVQTSNVYRIVFGTFGSQVGLTPLVKSALLPQSSRLDPEQYTENNIDNNPLTPFEKSLPSKGSSKTQSWSPEKALLPPGLSRETWVEWVTHRRQKRQPLTEVACKRQLKMLAQQSDPEAVVEQSLQNGWTGLFALKNPMHLAPITVEVEGNKFRLEMVDGEVRRVAL